MMAASPAARGTREGIGTVPTSRQHGGGSWLRKVQSRVAHQPCLGSWRALQYFVAGGQKSVIRLALDQLKHQIPSLEYLHAHHWQSTGRLNRRRWMALCPLHQDHQPRFVVDTGKSLFYCYGCGRDSDVIPDGPPQRCLDRLSNRLTKVLSEIRKLNPSE